jgi:hypothetical protein
LAGISGNSWTLYIENDGKCVEVAVDTAVRPATSAEGALEKLDEVRIKKS